MNLERRVPSSSPVAVKWDQLRSSLISQSSSTRFEKKKIRNTHKVPKLEDFYHLNYFRTSELQNSLRKPVYNPKTLTLSSHLKTKRWTTSSVLRLGGCPYMALRSVSRLQTRCSLRRRFRSAPKTHPKVPTMVHWALSICSGLNVSRRFSRTSGCWFWTRYVVCQRIFLQLDRFD